MPSKICPGCGKEKDYTEYYLTSLSHSTKGQLPPAKAGGLLKGFGNARVD